mmetsp:Transcript_149610/g.480216  ORF Transcript_149610/g.480216 Transcript_149610/m.480216 type:complete len:83 (+) Transcript_149610:4435-4683(+)
MLRRVDGACTMTTHSSQESHDLLCYQCWRSVRDAMTLLQCSWCVPVQQGWQGLGTRLHGISLYVVPSAMSVSGTQFHGHIRH